MNILVTGCAGFIGYHQSILLLKSKKNKIFGLDNLNNYYDTNLKKDRISNLNQYKNFKFYKSDICNNKKLNSIIKKNNIKYIIHLAAQAGVRHSFKNPKSYLVNNIDGFFSILETSRKNNIKHLIFASTSSVYGDSKKFPNKEDDNTDKPLSFYAASKKSNEVMAYSYSNIYKIPITALRFFTVYGPMGRPDMSLFKFTKSIINSKKIDLYNYGIHERDFTYIEDVTISINKLLKKPSKMKIPYNCFNIGSNRPKKLNYFIQLIEKNLNFKAKKNFLPMQLGDVYKTHADNKKLNKYINFKPKVSIDSGIKNFIKWFLNYYK